MRYFTANPLGLYNDDNNRVPENAIAISDELYQKLLIGQMSGKFIQADTEGKPILVDELLLCDSDHKIIADSRRAFLLTTANTEIAWRQDAVEAGIAMTEEVIALDEWKKYRVLLMRVDTSTAPCIAWPAIPES